MNLPSELLAALWLDTNIKGAKGDFAVLTEIVEAIHQYHWVKQEVQRSELVENMDADERSLRQNWTRYCMALHNDDFVYMDTIVLRLLSGCNPRDYDDMYVRSVANYLETHIPKPDLDFDLSVYNRWIDFARAICDAIDTVYAPSIFESKEAYQEYEERWYPKEHYGHCQTWEEIENVQMGLTPTGNEMSDEIAYEPRIVTCSVGNLEDDYPDDYDDDIPF